MTLDEIRENCDLIPIAGCWVWRGALSKNGYPQMRHDGKQIGGNRLVLTLAGRLTDKQALHACNVKSCCNPAHLHPGDNAQNRAESMHAGLEAKKLTLEQVRAIKQDTRKQADIARAYGVNHRTINDILRGRSWKHV